MKNKKNGTVRIIVLIVVCVIMLGIGALPVYLQWQMEKSASSGVGIIGGADGPTSIFLAGKLGTSASEEQDYSGRYVDTQGTEEVYSELVLERKEDGTYQTEISIYRVASLSGTSFFYGGMLMFEDTELGIKGIITISDEGKAEFAATKSEFEYITLGEVFEFQKQ